MILFSWLQFVEEEEAKKEENLQLENEDEDLKTIHRLLKELTAEADNLKG